MPKLPFPKLSSLWNHPLVWLVSFASCILYVLLTSKGLSIIAPWLMPNQLIELISIQWWRLWSPTLIHYTLLHLLTNLYLWWYFAAQIEGRSKTELIWVSLAIAASANLSQWFFEGSKFGGLSGLVYGLLAYVWLQQKFDRSCQYQVDTSIGILLLILIPLGAIGLVDQLASFAHIGGLVCGIALGGLVLLIRNPQNG